MPRVRPDKGKPALGHGHLPAVQNLALLHIHQSAAPDHKICRFPSSGDSNKAGGNIGPGFIRDFLPNVVQQPGPSQLSGDFVLFRAVKHRSHGT